MTDKYQESLDWIKLQLIGGNDVWFDKRSKCVDSLQELIDKYETIVRCLNETKDK